MASLDSTRTPRCCVCGRPGVAVFAFFLLAEAARTQGGIKLKLRDSDHFHYGCARRVAVKLKIKPSVANLGEPRP